MRLDTVPAPDLGLALANSDTDRIYLVSNTGLVQCLREVENVKPIQYNVKVKLATYSAKVVAAGEMQMTVEVETDGKRSVHQVRFITKAKLTGVEAKDVKMVVIYWGAEKAGKKDGT
jgi:hypothetical protein